MAYRTSAARNAAWGRLLEGAIRAEARLQRAQRREEREFRVIFVLAAILVLAAAAVSVSRGQSSPCPDAPRAVILARLTWHEAGVDALVDAGAIHASIEGLSRIREETWEDTACAYSGRALRGETRRAWISLLDGSGLAPPGFPHDRASWEVQGRLADRLLEHTDDVVAGDAAPACEVSPTDWGHPELDSARIERGIARGYWYRVSCPGARGDYLRRYALDELEAEELELAGGR